MITTERLAEIEIAPRDACIFKAEAKALVAKNAAESHEERELAQRCPDFDEDCVFVRDHALCAAGTVVFHSLYGILETPPIDGFCPYLCGMLRPASLIRR